MAAPTVPIASEKAETSAVATKDTEISASASEMVITQKLDVDSFLLAPKRDAAVPSEDGKLAFYQVSTNRFGEKALKELRILDLSSGKSWQLSNQEKVDHPRWISPHSIVWLNQVEKGVTQVVVGDARHPDDKPEEQYLAGEVDAPVDNLKVKHLDDGSIAIAVVGLVGADGKPHNEETAEKPKSTARIYDVLQVREWDTYVKPQKYSIWYSRLAKDAGKWKLDAPLQNAVVKSDLEAPDMMYEPEEPCDYYDISAKGIAFIARNPPPVDGTYAIASQLYYVPLQSYTTAVTSAPTKILPSSGHEHGMALSPQFSPDGSKIAFLKSPLDTPNITPIYLANVGSTEASDVFKTVIGSSWDLAPSSVEWAPDGNSFLMTAEDCGRSALYELELKHGAQPKAITRDGTVSGFFHLTSDVKERKLLVSSSNMVDPSVYKIYDSNMADEPKLISSLTLHGAKFGLSRSQVSEIYTEGAGDYCVQSWVVKPSDFDPKKKYPVVLSIHGGPAGAWHDQWHSRWNCALWAEQGYIVVATNFAGSLGFGADFQAQNWNEWGGRPYQDLVKCMEHLATLEYIDMDRAVAAGGSYGGYMVCWILGNDLARKFKATICHDPFFTMPLGFLHSDIEAGTAEFGGPPLPWLNWDNLNKWNPGKPELLARWKDAPPTLVIHSDQDFRCPVTDGLAVFKTLQYHKVPSRYLTYPNENHWVLKADNSRVWHNTVFEWMERWVGKGAAETK